MKVDLNSDDAVPSACINCGKVNSRILETNYFHNRTELRRICRNKKCNTIWKQIIPSLEAGMWKGGIKS